MLCLIDGRNQFQSLQNTLSHVSELPHFNYTCGCRVMSKKGIIVNKLTEMTFQELVYRMFGIINIRTKGIQTFPPVFYTVFIFLLTLVILFFFLLPPPRRYFSKACTFLCKHTPGKAKTAISLPVLLILQYAEYSIVYISLFVIRELLTWAVRGKKLPQLIACKASLTKQSSPNYLLIRAPRRHKPQSL